MAKSLLSAPFVNASIWVDTFLLLSGFLVAYYILIKYKRTLKGSERMTFKIKDVILLFIHRYLRLTPSLLAAIGASILAEALGDGPIWFKYVDSSQQFCHSSWIYNILYVNNWSQSSPHQGGDYGVRINKEEKINNNNNNNKQILLKWNIN